MVEAGIGDPVNVMKENRGQISLLQEEAKQLESDITAYPSAQIPRK